MKIILILAVLFLAIIGLAWLICSSVSKLHRDPNDPNVWYDDEGNEYHF